MATYADEDDWAINQNYASWTAYALANPNSPTLAHITELLTKGTRIINKNIGCYSTNVSDTRFTGDLLDLNITMVNRMRQIELGQGMAGQIPLFSPNDFLIEREREDLKNYGKILGYRKVGRIVF